MSRYIVKTDGWQVHFGYDHACGYWIQAWSIDAVPRDEDPEINLDSVFDDLSGGDLLTRLLECGVPAAGTCYAIQPHSQIPLDWHGRAMLPQVISRIALDLPV